MAIRNVFVMALDDFNRAMLERLQGVENLRFHSLLDLETAVDTRHYDIPALLDRARRQLRAFPGSIDAIVGFWDFPTSTMLPILRREFGLRGPSVESVMRCEHKYWFRMNQEKVAPSQTPAYAAFNPFDSRFPDEAPLAYPFWIKPIRSHSSQLGFRINDRSAFADGLTEIRDNIDFLARPFNELMTHAEMPEEVRTVDGWHCLAEEIISAGRQCTVEGYVLDGEIVIYGTIDSLREGVHGSSFSRYQYPSDLPVDVQEAMYKATHDFLKQVGFDDSPFNIEFFYEEDTGQLWMLEVNTRCSKSHSPLFEMVDGASNTQAMVDVALGRKPDFPEQGGDYRLATKFMLREHEDAYVRRVPTADEIAAIEADIPGVRIQIVAHEGYRLSTLFHQDSYTFETALLFIGGDSLEEIERKSEQVKGRLHFELER
ncbi:D-alanine--D-alanine ligase [Halovibrio salipaludis]|uniref:D-alanine--D-alanine ligase n=2 Tax=Halovibrio salipaludis TaxID=2032626 RepID=A0A2A2F5Z0_9GAMM|nr:D-alanine--D-alanine ligase [Halovibrio salipaludis]